MNLEWLEDFVALAETRNFSRAAERRNVTQPAFSRRIQALEEWLGARLFVRSPHKVGLTAAGEAVRGEAEALLRAAYRFRSMVAEAARPAGTTLHFAATHSLSFSFFPGWIKETGQCLAHAGAAVNLISDTMASCEKALIRGEAQFLLCHAGATPPSRFTSTGFLSAVVGRDTLSPYAAPDSTGAPLWHLDAEATPVQWLQYSGESGFARMMEGHPNIVSRLAGSPPVVTSRLATVLLSMVEDGRGMAWLPSSLVGLAVEHGKIVAAGGPAWDIHMDIRLFRARATLSPVAERLWAAISQKS